jgi:hypothetical protein
MSDMSMLFTKEDRLKKIVIDGDEFTIMALLPFDQLNIDRMSAQMKRGIPTESYSYNGGFRIDQYAKLAAAVESGPPEWKGPETWPIQDTLDRLHAEIESWSDEFQERLKKNRRRK